MWTTFLLEEVHVLADNPVELLLNNSWRPLAVTGQDGMPSVPQAGNVLLPQLTYKLSLRLPPTLAADKATAAVKRVLETAHHLEPASPRGRWHEWLECSPLAPWLAEVTDTSSQEFFVRRPASVLAAIPSWRCWASVSRRPSF